MKFETTEAVKDRLRQAGANNQVLAAVEREAFANARKKLEEEPRKVEEEKKRLEA